jgi:cystathionine beta-lyase/cystathionine gamma-synthase
MKKLSTRLVQRSRESLASVESLTLPIYETTTYVFDSAEQVREYNEGKGGKYLYSRYENPTIRAVERTLALLEGADAAVVLSSGQAATTTALLALVSAGDEVVCSAAIYGGTLHLLTEVFQRLGVQVRFATLEQFAAPEQLLSERTRVVWFESPINPTLRCIDIARVSAACRARGVVSVLDSTFASPINQQPLALGVDLVMHSATKYLNGHTDVTAGALIGPAAIIDKIEKVRRRVGTIMDPQPAYALARGLKTLAVRVQRQNASAMAVAEWLSRRGGIDKVYYPGLPQHPDHAIAAKQMTGFGGMVCVDLGGGYERAASFFDRLQVFQRAASLGGVESLCSLPVLTSQWGHTDDELRQAGVTRSMARLSIGLEDAEDLIADLDQAIGEASRP